MKAIKKLFLLIFILTICAVMASCSGDGANETPASTGENGEEVEKVLSRVVLGSYDKEDIGKSEKALEYLNKVLIPKEGLKVEFVLSSKTEDKLDRSNYRELLRKKDYIVLELGEILSVFNLTNIAKDMSVYKDLAPTVFDRRIKDARMMPVDNFNRYNYDLFAFVRNDMYENYAKDTKNKITSIDEYEVFLDWVISQKMIGMKPLIADGLSYDDDYLSTHIFSVFLPKYGYAPLANYNTELDTLFVDMSSGAICELSGIPETVLTNLINDVKRWQTKYKLIKQEIAYTEYESPKYIASALTHISSASMGDEFAISVNTPDLLVTPSDYHVFTLNSGLMPANDIWQPVYHFMAKEKLDASEFLIFLEKMTSDIDFYKRLMYGVEGVDYEWSSDNKMVLLETSNFYEYKNLFKQSLVNIPMEGRIKANSRPVNYCETVDKMEYKDVPGFHDMMVKTQTEDFDVFIAQWRSQIGSLRRSANTVMQMITTDDAETEELVKKLMKPAQLRKLIEYLEKPVDSAKP